MKYPVAVLVLLSAHAAWGCPFLQLRERAKEERRRTREATRNHHRALREDASNPPSAEDAAGGDADAGDASDTFVALRHHRQLQDCAGDGARAKDCGANANRAPQSCCPGFECDSPPSRRCVAVTPSGPTTTTTTTTTADPNAPPLFYVGENDWPADFRSFNGTGNNEANPNWGAADGALLRSVPADYSGAAGNQEPAGPTRPNPRDVSNAIANETSSKVNSVGVTDLFWQWGQFLDHDLSFTESSLDEFFRIDIPRGDPILDPNSTGAVVIDFARSLFENDGAGVRQQLNSVSSYIDASLVYGEDEGRASALKGVKADRGRLATNVLPRGVDGEDERFLPYNVDGLPNKGGTNATDLFLAGDFRANEHVGLVALHTLFVREHNYWANVIYNKYNVPSVTLTGEEVYERARIMVAAEIQAVTYNEFLPVLLGRDWDANATYAGYDDTVNAGVSNVFAAAAFRVGHTMVSDRLLCQDENGSEIADCSVDISDAFFGTDSIEYYGIDPYLRGMAAQVCQEIDTEVVDSLRNFLFSDPGSPVPGGFDLVALNIQRGRDHGLGSYNDVREAFGLGRLSSFGEFRGIGTALRDTLSTLYGGDIDDVDAWVGMLAEEHVQDAMVGETLKAVLTDQFVRLRDGDRFWYKGDYLGDALIAEVERHTLNDIVVRNTGITGGITFKLGA